MADMARTNSFWLLCLILPLARATCYNTFGSIMEGDVPCNPDNDVSHCCSKDDYCLSNGLCFDAGGNNVMTQQSCTDPNWGAPCHKFCTEHNGFDNQIAVLPCDQSWDGGGGLSYCCDPNAADCCSSSAWFDVPVGTVVRDPVGTATSRASSPTSSATDPASSTKSDKSSSGTTSPPKNSDASSNSNSDSDTKKIGLGVGLGVGIPVILALAGAVAFLAVKLRRAKQTSSQYAPAYENIPPQEHMPPHALPKVEAPTAPYHYEMPAEHVN